MNFKRQLIISILLLCTYGYMNAQYFEDDIYYDSSKKKTENSTINTTENIKSSQSERDIDEYNRRGDNETYVIANDSISSLLNESDDYEYTQRIQKFYNPTIIINSGDPALYNLIYSSSIADNIILSVTNPFYWDYYGYNWGWYNNWRWNSWYGPYWGWSPSYDPWWGGYPHWGGHHPHWGPSWNGHHQSYIPYAPNSRRPFGYTNNSNRRPSYNSGNTTNTNRPSASGSNIGRKPSSTNNNSYQNNKKPSTTSPGRRPSSESKPNNTRNYDSDRGNYNTPSYNRGSSTGGSRGSFGGNSGGSSRPSGGGRR